MGISAGLARVIAGLVCCVGVCSCTTTYIGRYFYYGLADADDHKKFPSRPIANAPPPFRFGKAPAPPGWLCLGRGRHAHRGAAIDRFLRDTDTTAFLVIHHDTVLYERYFNGYRRDSIQPSFSIAKSFLSALVGIAIHQGHLQGLDTPITTYLPELARRDPRFARITIRHLLTMTSGLFYIDYDLPWSDPAKIYYSPDLRALALGVQVEDAPGKTWEYNSYHAVLLGMILERTTGRSVSTYLEQEIWKPLGMEFPASWSLDSQSGGCEKMETGLNARAIDVAKLGRLYLHDGRWRGRQILPPGWARQSTSPPVGQPHMHTIYGKPGLYYKYMWWGYQWANGHHDFLAIGELGQFLYVVPERDLIILRHGLSWRGPDYYEWIHLLRSLAESLPAGPRAGAAP